MELIRICTPPIPDVIEIANLILYKGITFKKTFEFTDENGEAISLTDGTITFHILDSNEEEILEINSIESSELGSIINIIDEEEGIVELVLTHQETSELSFSYGYWWITFTSSADDIYLKGKGSVYLKEPYN